MGGLVKQQLPINKKEGVKIINPILIDGKEEEGIARTVMLYGVSGIGKSTLLAEAAQQAFKKYGKPSLLISAEDSSKSIFLPSIQLGQIKALFISKISHPVEVMRKLSRGEWFDGNEWVKEMPFTPSMIFIEGFTSIAEIIQESNRDNQRFLGENKEKNNFTEGDEVLTLPGQFSYNFTQLEMLRYVRSFGMRQGVERIIWTSHEIAADPQGPAYVGGPNRGPAKPVRGPASVGNAATDSVQKLVGTLLRIVQEEDERRIYFDLHPDPFNKRINYPARLTVPILGRQAFINKLGAKNNYVSVKLEGNKFKGGLWDILEAEEYGINATREALK